MQPSLSKIEKLIEELATQIQVPQYLLPTNKNNEGTHIEINHGHLYYFHTERGQENFRYLAKDVDDLLYKIFEGATLMMASTYELKNRVKGHDSRRGMWEEQVRLLGILNKNWELRCIKEIEQILINYPFDENAIIRVDYFKELVKSGPHPVNEWVLACEKYPLLDKK